MQTKLEILKKLSILQTCRILTPREQSHIIGEITSMVGSSEIVESQTLHDQAAIAALQGVCANPEVWKELSTHQMCNRSFEMADEFMRQRAEREKQNAN